MLRYQGGDAAAFEILYARHKGGLYRFILRGCRDAASAEELFQDVWMNLINARQRYEVRAKFRTWLYQIAQHRIIDHRRRSNTAATDSGMAAELDAVSAPPAGQPERRVASAQAAARMLELLGALPAEQRDVFLLHEEGSMSIREIAEVAGINPETVKSRLRYALKKLREGLGPYHE